MRQRLEVQAIPVTEVLYRGWFGGRQSLWIYGSEQAVLGDWLLLTNWWAVTGAMVTGVGAAALLWTMVAPTLPGGGGIEELVKKEPGPTPKEERTPKPATAPQVKPAPKVSSSPKGNAGTHGLESPKGGQQPESVPGSGESGSKVPEFGATQNPVGKPAEVASPSPPPSPQPSSPPSARLSALGAQCKEFGRIAGPQHAFLVDFQSNVMTTAAATFAVSGITNKREAVKNYLSFLEQEIAALDTTAKGLRAMQVTDERLGVIRSRYAGAVEVGLESLLTLRQELQQQLQASDEQWYEEATKVAPLLEQATQQGDVVQREVFGMMKDGTNYCWDKY